MELSTGGKNVEKSITETEQICGEGERRKKQKMEAEVETGVVERERQQKMETEWREGERGRKQETAAGEREQTMGEGGGTSRERQEENGSDLPVPVADLSGHFSQELEAARSRLCSPPNSHLRSPDPPLQSHDQPATSHDPPPLMKSPSTPLTHSSQPPSSTPLRPSFGHRAGFDAFMTAHVFTYYAIVCKELNQKPANLLTDTQTQSSNEVLMAGVSSMKNQLHRGGNVPLLVAKSQFVKTSAAHKEIYPLISQFGV